MTPSRIPLLRTRSYDCQSGVIPSFVYDATTPIILRNLVSRWPIVIAGENSPLDLASYFNEFYNDKPTSVFQGKVADGGNYFYGNSATEFNFDTLSLSIKDVLENLILQYEKTNPTPYYIASCPIDEYFPGLLKDNSLSFSSDFSSGFSINGNPLVNLWLGNKSRSACHFDVPNNLACCVLGERRFTLLPPSQVSNIYPGPYDFNPGGQVISMVNFDQPDFSQHPNFKNAQEHIQIAELNAGDTLFIPSMWWHQVEALSPLNAMINYWWNTSPRYLGQGKPALEHAIMSIRHLPKEQKKAWEVLFNHYVFSDNATAEEHLPKKSRGILGALTEVDARRLRAKLLRFLNR